MRVTITTLVLAIAICAAAQASENFVSYSDQPSMDNHAMVVRGVTEDHMHLRAHQGMRYSLVTRITATVGEAAYILLTSPTSTTMMHMEWVASCPNVSHVSIYESPNAAGGTPYTIYNRNRDSANTSGATLASAPTVTTTGTLLSEHSLYSGKKEGGYMSNDEWILAPSTKYLFELTNDDTQATIFDFELRWAEFLEQ